MSNRPAVFGESAAKRIARAARTVEKVPRNLSGYPIPLRLDGGSKQIRVRITAAASGGGKYDGKSLTGGSSAAATGNLAESDIGTLAAAAVDCLVLHAGEVGKSTHVIPADTYASGVIVGSTSDSPPKKIVVIPPYGAGGALFAVNLTQTGGSAGNSTTYCSFTYTVKDLDNNTLVTGAAPECPRLIKAAYTAATKGSAYIASNGTVTLHQAFEQITQENCS